MAVLLKAMFLPKIFYMQLQPFHEYGISNSLQISRTSFSSPCQTGVPTHSTIESCCSCLCCLLQIPPIAFLTIVTAGKFLVNHFRIIGVKIMRGTSVTSFKPDEQLGGLSPLFRLNRTCIIFTYHLTIHIVLKSDGEWNSKR